MPRPKDVVTESQFPLDDGYEDTVVDQPFSVIVQWTDLTESPTAAITRLNQEVMEIAATAKAQRERRIGLLNRFGEYEVVYETRENAAPRTVLQHIGCGDVVAVIGQGNRRDLLSRLVQRTDSHDCSVKARIARAHERVRRAHDLAVSRLQGADSQNTSPEYVRALAELVTEMIGLPMDRRDEVAAHLWAESGAQGDVPLS